MADDRKPFGVIDGGGKPARSTFKREQGKDWTLFDCPICRREDGVEWSQLARIVRGALTDGEFISLEYATEETYLVCTRCLAMGRAGLQYKPGCVALWFEGEGWVRLEKI